MKWGNLKALAESTGLSVRTLQYIRKQEPNVLRWRGAGARVEYDLGACNTNLRTRERALALRDTEPKDFEEARTRKLAAEARLAEIELAHAEGRVVTVEDSELEWGPRLDAVRATMLTIPSKWAPEMVGHKTVGEAQAALAPLVTRALTSWSGRDQETAA